MTYNSGDLARIILYHINDLININNETIKLEILVFEERNNVSIGISVFDKVVEFIYKRVLELREIILNCLHDMTSANEVNSTEMHVDNENYMNIMRDRYSEERYPQLSSILSESELMKLVFSHIKKRYKKITHRYKIIEDKLNNHKRLSEETFKNLRVLNSHRLYDFELEHLWRRYQHRWEETHPHAVKTETLTPFAKTSKSSRNTNTSDNVTIIRPDSFSDKIKRYVREHIGDKMLTIEEFEQITMGWSKTRRTMNEWYDIYVDLYSQQPGHAIKIDDMEIRGSGYKTKNNNRLRSFTLCTH